MTVKVLKLRRLVVIMLLVFSGIIVSRAVMAADNIDADAYNAIQKMAMIMHRLKHFPSPQSKDILQGIVDNKTTSERERDLATAILNLNHRALMDDKIKLKKIMENQSASADERDLASIIYNLDHRPTKNDKIRLEKMMQ